VAAFIAFGEKHHPPTTVGGRVAGPTDRDYGLLVAEDAEDVVRGLDKGDFRPFTRRWGQSVEVKAWVNPAAVAYVQEHGD
jgi:hypothetical protein